jgi:hypothetical protein
MIQGRSAARVRHYARRITDYTIRGAMRPTPACAYNASGRKTPSFPVAGFPPVRGISVCEGLDEISPLDGRRLGRYPRSTCDPALRTNSDIRPGTTSRRATSS